ncbi:MAG: serine/threonine-protein kinase [Myxococcales bacterium]
MSVPNTPRSEETPDPYLGLVVSGVFRLEELIGLGTMGRVYRATQLALSRPVAIKIIHRHLMQTPAIRQRFHREARLAARLVHPGLVQVLASGELESLPKTHRDEPIGGEPYLVSEYLPGISLRQQLLEKRLADLPQIVAFMLAIGDAVGAAHAQQIVHRDLKPENLMSVPADQANVRHVVLDFGLARALDVQQDPLTHEGAILGTPQYMSPEAARGSQATPRSDVYALATILYELLVGHPPFTCASPMRILMHQAESPPPPIPSALGVPRPIVDCVERELSKSPQARSVDANKFASRLALAALNAGLTRAQILLPQISETMLRNLDEVAS